MTRNYASSVIEDISLTAMANVSYARQIVGHLTPGRSQRCSQNRSNTPFKTPCRTSSPKKKVKHNGQLKISLALERNTLSVHIVEASNLRSTWKDLCDPYVQLQVCPDDDECISRKRTVIRNDTNSPFYDQTFTYPIDVSLPENKKKRLIISAWHQDVRKNCAEFLGCMSFGLSHLAFKAKGKKMEGWYHFLPEESGHKKHLQVNASILATKTPSNNPLETTGSARETFTLAVHRVQEGFGFTVKGACPCRVGRVKRGGPAHSVGLQHGDIIREINGIDVRRSTAESLAVIIRKASHMVVLEVYRSNKAHMDSSCASSRLSSIPSIDLNHAIMEVQDENCPPPFSLTSESKSTSFSRRTVIGSSCKNILNEQALDSGSKRKAFVCDRTETKDVTIQSVKWDPEMSAIERSDSCSTMDLNPHLFKNFMSMPNLSELEDEEEEDCAMNIATVDDSEDDIRSKDLETSWADESAMNNTSLTVDMHLPWQGECTLSDDDLVGGSTACGRRDVFSDASGSSGNKSDPQQSILNATLLAQSVQELVNIEKDFASRIIAGIGCYSRPMRHCLPSLKKHRYLFQNLEKIAQTSTYLAKALKEEKESAGTVYASRVEILCEMYEMYLSGLPRAQQLLSDLETDAQFHEFLKLTARSTGISIHELISQPVHHIKTLHTTLKTIQSHATVNSSEYMHLSAVISELETTMTQQRHHMPENQTSLKKKKASISDSMLSLLSDMSAMTTIGSTSSRDEMVDLQSFLVIPKHIKKFKLANGRRHLVHYGDVEAQDGRPMVIVLLSDLLLITIVTEDGDSLLVLQEPMLLENMQLDCDRKNVCEFSISTPVRNGVGYHQVIFSVESEEEKKTWKKYLEHRITSCNRQSYSELPSTSQVLDVL